MKQLILAFLIMLNAVTAHSAQISKRVNHKSVEELTNSDEFAIFQQNLPASKLAGWILNFKVESKIKNDQLQHLKMNFEKSSFITSDAGKSFISFKKSDSLQEKDKIESLVFLNPVNLYTSNLQVARGLVSTEKGQQLQLFHVKVMHANDSVLFKMQAISKIEQQHSHVIADESLNNALKLSLQFKLKKDQLR